ncbi:hypothetical protein B0H14DRAFT_1279669 [Mycena olivaceomarginata]|nr:hypothetical protein B0H14DRAFT_1279669 [Mycena olivaceomarginata]
MHRRRAAVQLDGLFILIEAVTPSQAIVETRFSPLFDLRIFVFDLQRPGVSSASFRFLSAASCQFHGVVDRLPHYRPLTIASSRSRVLHAPRGEHRLMLPRP